MRCQKLQGTGFFRKPTTEAPHIKTSFAETVGDDQVAMERRQLSTKFSEVLATDSLSESRKFVIKTCVKENDPSLIAVDGCTLFSGTVGNYMSCQCNALNCNFSMWTGLNFIMLVLVLTVQFIA